MKPNLLENVGVPGISDSLEDERANNGVVMGATPASLDAASWFDGSDKGGSLMIESTAAIVSDADISTATISTIPVVEPSKFAGGLDFDPALMD